ncbi:D123 PROTEIN [Salix koriyanagi]|uniref:D123 PROTEIN n=1 Tax=Salix koriyanagi TaxID=2511006 RepID=A0A9Q0UP50_9ROSI|nr:D123 PROTEIN [Salix koriyanagi]
MKEEDVNRCQIQEWYPKFKTVSIRTVIHELPESFVKYLIDDSGPFLLPLSISGEDALPNRIHNPIDEEDYQVSQRDLEMNQNNLHWPPSFPELELNIKESINTLGGAVFPKLNWSAPKDSAEIALLLRSSDSLVHDLCHAYDSCIDKTLSRPPSFFLALRKWYSSFLPEMEFRCFVRGQQLIGISQREVTTYYPTLLEKRNYLQLLIKEFFTEKVRLKFESENYTFDVYVTKDGRAKILDFNPWGAFTLPLLFTWEELEQNLKEEENVVDFRIVESQCGIRPGLKTAVPQDYLDTGPGSGWDQFLRKADEELQQQKMDPGNGA